MEKRPVAYQIYSAREEAAKDLDAVLASLKAMGYDGVEFAGYYGYTAEEIKALLDKHGLKAISAHVPYEQMRDDPYSVIAFHKVLGSKYIAVPYLDAQTRPGTTGFSQAIRVISQFGSLLKEAGMTLLYHNHDFEFVDVSGQYGLDFLYDAVSADVLQTELDVCWVKYAGENPADYIRKYAGRCPVVHLKDYVCSKKDGATPYALIGQAEKGNDDAPAFEFRPFGYGSQNVEEVVNAGIESGAEWFIIEQDRSVGRTPLEAAEMSIGTLKKIGLK